MLKVSVQIKTFFPRNCVLGLALNEVEGYWVLRTLKPALWPILCRYRTARNRYRTARNRYRTATNRFLAVRYRFLAER